jgi:hypothetical protein
MSRRHIDANVSHFGHKVTAFEKWYLDWMIKLIEFALKDADHFNNIHLVTSLCGVRAAFVAEA